jgi:hypothetical protein
MRDCFATPDTVELVSSSRLYQRVAGDGRVLVFSVPDDNDSTAIGKVLLVRLEQARAAMEEFDVDFDDFDAFDDGDEELDGDAYGDDIPLQLHPTWWAIDPGCDHTGPECACGFITLIEVLHCVDEEERAEVLEHHLHELRALWHHYWSAQALIEAGSETLEGTCAWCITAGRAHLVQLSDEAGEMAEQLGEALAGFDATVTVGRSRYGDQAMRRELPPSGTDNSGNNTDDPARTVEPGPFEL